VNRRPLATKPMPESRSRDDSERTQPTHQRGEIRKATKEPKKGRCFDPQLFLTKADLGTSVAGYRPNRKIFSQGDPCDAIFYVQKGKVKLSVISKQGKEAIIAILGPGDFIAETCLTGQSLHMASATPIVPSIVMKIPKKDMLRALQKEPALSSHFISYLLSRNRRIEDDLINQLFNSSEKRLARTLLLLANVGKEDKSENVISDISQETLAKMVGVSRERVNVLMNKFRKLGFISYDGGLEVHTSLLSIVLKE